MRLIIQRHIFKSMMGPLAVCLLIFTFTFFIYRIFELTDLALSKGVGFGAVLRLFLYASPSFFMFTIPMSVMFAVLVAFMRLRGNNELTALKAAGVSLYTLLPPVLILLVSSWLITLFIATSLLPQGNTAMRDTLFRVAATQTDAAVRERIFIEDFQGLTIFVRSVDRLGRELGHVFIYDDRGADNDAVVIARKGVFLKDPGGGRIVLRLYDGIIDQLARDWSQTQSITFATYDLNLNLKSLASEHQRVRHRTEWSMARLWQEMEELPQGRQRGRMAREFYERLAIPSAVLALGLLAVPLAVGFRGGAIRKSWGAFRGVMVFLVYYLFYSGIRSFADNGDLPHWIGLWIPNLICFLLALFLLRQSAGERSMPLLERISQAISRWNPGAFFDK